jgi:hypothetical protein
MFRILISDFFLILILKFDKCSDLKKNISLKKTNSRKQKETKKMAHLMLGCGPVGTRGARGVR